MPRFKIEIVRHIQLFDDGKRKGGRKYWAIIVLRGQRMNKVILPFRSFNVK